jgi:CelD/BcsL family acetyltransferase involved in cellulose biosynthesis
LQDEWRAFQQHADCTAFQTYEWLAAWQRCVGSVTGSTPAIVAGRDGDGSLLFLFPLSVRLAGSMRQLTWLGSKLNDYNGPLLAPSFSKALEREQFGALWDRVLQAIQQEPGLRFDAVLLEKMPLRVGEQQNPFASLRTRVHPSGAYRTQLGEEWQAFYAAKRSSATRSRDRSKRKKLGQFGELRFVTADQSDIGQTLQVLFAQKAQSFAHMGVANLFERPGHSQFFQDLATNEMTRSLVHVSKLDVGGTIAAVNFGLMFRGVYYYVLASYCGGEIAKFGPGAAHLRDLMSYAIDKGCRVFDFTIGDEPYKREWSDTELQLVDHFAIAGLKGLPAALAEMASIVKRTIKQTPALWYVVTRVRSFAGLLKGALYR